MPPSAKSTATVASRVGRFRVGAPLLSGALWTISEATVVEGKAATGPIAVRRIHPSLLEGDAQASILASAESALGLTHPNIFTTTEILEEWDDLTFVMQKPEGTTLREVLDEGELRGEALPVPVVVRIALEVLAALEALHAHALKNGSPAPLFPCDLSPENVLVDPSGGVRLLDVTTDRAINAVEIRRTLSSARYLAPERLESGLGTPASDLFATGVLTWELLASKHLFGSRPGADIVKDVLSGPIPRLDVAGVRSAGALPTKLASVVAKALSRAPAGRYKSAEELGRAMLEGASAGVASPGELASAVAKIVRDRSNEERPTAAPPEAIAAASPLNSRRTAPPPAAAIAPPPPRKPAGTLLNAGAPPIAPARQPSASSAALAAAQERATKRLEVPQAPPVRAKAATMLGVAPPPNRAPEIEKPTIPKTPIAKAVVIEEPPPPRAQEDSAIDTQIMDVQATLGPLLAQASSGKPATPVVAKKAPSIPPPAPAVVAKRPASIPPPAVVAKRPASIPPPAVVAKRPASIPPTPLAPSAKKAPSIPPPAFAARGTQMMANAPPTPVAKAVAAPPARTPSIPPAATAPLAPLTRLGTPSSEPPPLPPRDLRPPAVAPAALAAPQLPSFTADPPSAAPADFPFATPAPSTAREETNIARMAPTEPPAKTANRKPLMIAALGGLAMLIGLVLVLSRKSPAPPSKPVAEPPRVVAKKDADPPPAATPPAPPPATVAQATPPPAADPPAPITTPAPAAADTTSSDRPSAPSVASPRVGSGSNNSSYSAPDPTPRPADPPKPPKHRYNPKRI